MPTQQKSLDYWAMKNLETSEYDSVASFSSWAEWDVITDTSDDDNNDNP